MSLKHSVLPKKYYGRKSLELIDIKSLDRNSIYFDSVTSLIEYVKLNTGEGVSHPTINKYAESERVFKDKWVIKFSGSKNTSSSVKENLNIHTDLVKISSVKDCTEDRKTISPKVSVAITDITNDKKFVFKSLTEAAKFIKMETGKGTPEGLKYALNKGTAYLNIYLVADRTESIRLTDLKTNESQLFVNLKEVAK